MTEINSQEHIERATLDIFYYAHNQEKFVERALKSIATQDLSNFSKVRVLLIDDASTDGTLDRISTLVPLFFRNVKNSEKIVTEIRFRSNNVARGQTLTLVEGFAWSESDFLAVLEGDDFWLSSAHLNNLFWALETMPSVSSAFASWTSFDSRNQVVITRSRDRDYIENNHFIDTGRLLVDNPPGTLSACMYRGNLLKVLVSKIDGIENLADWGTNLFMSQFGPLYWHEEISLCYWHEPGSLWRSASAQEQNKQMLRALRSYLPIFDEKFHDILEGKISKLELGVSTQILFSPQSKLGLIKRLLNVAVGFARKFF